MSAAETFDNGQDDASENPADSIKITPRRGFHCIPAALRERPQWVVWKIQHRGPKPTKVPYRVSNPFAKAATDDPNTWGTFDQAIKVWNNRDRTQVNGIGYVFSADDPYCGIDFDNCLSEGRLSAWAHPHLAKLQPTYCEVSPSGKGLKLWVVGKLPGKGTKKSDYAGKGTGTAIEMYDQCRFFTTTGATVNFENGTIADRSEYVAELYETLKAKPKKSSGPRPQYVGDDRPVLCLSDSELIAKARRAKNGGKFAQLWSGADEGKGSASEGDMALCAMIAFFTGPDPDRIERIFNSSLRAGRDKWQARPDYRAMTIAAALEGMVEFYTPPSSVRLKVVPVDQADAGREPEGEMAGGDSSPPPSGPDADQVGQPEPAERPTIVITLEEHQVTDESVMALALDSEVYYRGCHLSEVVREPTPPSKTIRRAENALRIAPMEQARIRDVLTRDAVYVRMVWDPEMKDYVQERCSIPKWLVPAVAARGVWPGIRPITGIVETPILLPDGSILTTHGYDRTTGLFYAPGAEFPVIPDKPTLEDARKAAKSLFKLVAQFPFFDETHKAGWLSGLLTPFARFAIDGPVPLHHFDANSRATGKTLLTEIIAIAISGREMPRTAYTDDDNEFRKRITAIALGGDPLMLFDNIDAPFGGASFDAALTATTWKDRILGISGMTGALPLMTCFYGSGNNTSYKGDITRRMILCRLQTSLQDPDKRTDIKIPDLDKYAKEHRPEIVKAVLTILRAHFVAGRPTGGLTPMASYSDWSAIVRNAIFWATGIDPLDSTKYLKATDTEALSRASLIEAWSHLPGQVKGVTALEALTMCRSGKADKLKAVLLEFSRNDDLPSPRSVGMKLTHLRDRIIGNKRFVGTEDSPVAWSVQTVFDPGTNGTNGTNSNRTSQTRDTGDLGGCNNATTEDDPCFTDDPSDSPSSPVSPDAPDLEYFEL